MKQAAVVGGTVLGALAVVGAYAIIGELTGFRSHFGSSHFGSSLFWLHVTCNATIVPHLVLCLFDILDQSLLCNQPHPSFIEFHGATFESTNNQPHPSFSEFHGATFESTNNLLWNTAQG